MQSKHNEHDVAEHLTCENMELHRSGKDLASRLILSRRHCVVSSSNTTAFCHYARHCVSSNSDWMLVGRPRGRISITGRGKNFPQVLQTNYGVQPAPYSMGTCGS
jgi:hypothetical protein